MMPSVVLGFIAGFYVALALASTAAVFVMDDPFEHHWAADLLAAAVFGIAWPLVAVWLAVELLKEALP